LKRLAFYWLQNQFSVFGDLKEAKDRKLTEYVLIGIVIEF
jgi:hypothetical protein